MHTQCLPFTVIKTVMLTFTLNMQLARSSLRPFWWSHTHLATRCAKWMEITCTCSQTTARGEGCVMLSVVPREGAGRAPLAVPGAASVRAAAKQTPSAVVLFAFCWKEKILFIPLLVSKIRFCKSKVTKAWTLKLREIPVSPSPPKLASFLFQSAPFTKLWFIATLFWCLFQ